MTAGLVLGLFALMALNIPVAFAMLLAAIAYLTVLDQVPLIVVAQQAAAGTDKFLLLAIPFFFLAAELMSVGGSLQRLMDFSHALVGHIRGGLGQVNVVSSMLFAGMTGSAVADAAGPGRIEIEMMRRAGYDVGFSAAITGASATIGPIIPPSIPFVVYGSLAEVSVGKLFIAGILPGVAMGLFLMGSVWWIAGRRSFPCYRWPGWAETASRFVRALPVLVLPLVILGGIFSGVFTPTESAVVAAGYALLLGFATRELRSADLGAILLRVGADTSRIMLIVVASDVFSWILAREGVPQALAAATLALTDEPWLVLLLINVLLLLLGTVMEPLPIMVLVVPVLMPLVRSTGHRSGAFRRRRDAEPDDRPDHAAGWPRHVHDDGHREGVDGALRPRKPAVPGGPAAGAPSGDLRPGARTAPTAARVRPIGRADSVPDQPVLRPSRRTLARTRRWNGETAATAASIVSATTLVASLDTRRRPAPRTARRDNRSAASPTAAIFSVTINAISGSASLAGCVTAAPIMAVRVAITWAAPTDISAQFWPSFTACICRFQSAPMPPPVLPRRRRAMSSIPASCGCLDAGAAWRRQ